MKKRRVEKWTTDDTAHCIPYIYYKSVLYIIVRKKEKKRIDKEKLLGSSKYTAITYERINYLVNVKNRFIQNFISFFIFF